MRLLHLVLAAVLANISIPAVSAETEPAVRWVREFERDALSAGKSASIDTSGNLAVAGVRVAPGNRYQSLPDATLIKFDPQGFPIWSAIVDGGGADLGVAVAHDRLDNVFLVGQTDRRIGDFYFGDYDVFVSKFDTNGALLWQRQLGSSAFEDPSSAVTDDVGNLYVSGITLGDFGSPRQGDFDGFVSKLTPEGIVAWTRRNRSRPGVKLSPK